MKNKDVVVGGFVAAVLLAILPCAIVFYIALPAANLKDERFCYLLLLFGVCVAMVLTLFFREREDCSSDGTTGLLICGSLEIGVLAFGLVLTTYSPLSEQAIALRFYSILLFIINMIVLFTIRKRSLPNALTVIWAIVGLVIAVFLLFYATSSVMFHADTACEVADVTVDPEPITEAFSDLTKGSDKLPLIDLNTARVLGDKKVAQLGHASWYDVDDAYNLVHTSDGYYRLSVVDYGDLLKWEDAKSEGLPGYVLVAVTPEDGVVTQEAKMVELDDAIRYSPGAYWAYDLRRHLREQYPSYMFEQSSLEIDNEGHPFWVTGVLRPTAGVFGIKTVTTFVMTDAITGVSTEYAVDEAPIWVDHIFSVDYLMWIAGWHYAYQDGFLNNYFGKTNVLRTSYTFRDRYEDTESGEFANFFGYSSIVGKDGNVMLYTGLTAANEANSNLGWLTIDTRTGKMTEYSIVGAEESSAQAAVEQLVQAQGYEATFPLPVNIAGEPSYVMCLKGKAGFPQAYGICNVANYSIAVQANTLTEAICLYQSRLEREGAVDNSSATGLYGTPGETMTMTGTIEAVFTADINGTTHFYYQIGGTLYRSAITVNELQVAYKVGDTVQLDYIVSEGGDMPQVTAINVY